MGRILIIDNFDSFVHNLARYIREAGWDTLVYRNDALTVEQCWAIQPDGILVSPGPKRPQDAGLSLDLIRSLKSEVPFLGVCLGHQCLVEVFAGQTVRAEHPLHGEASLISHDGTGLFCNVPSPTRVGRYHSLIAKPAADAPLRETAWSLDGELMAVAHESHPWFGVQFHPESLLTQHGHEVIGNFLSYCGKARDE